ncbi:MAG: class I SAM-dependent methyltransferase [Desulfatibacillaceae bacterium]
MNEIFDPHAEDYDRWYETPEGSAIFREELECLRLLKGTEPVRWLEVGVGTGRFASALNIGTGIDPSKEMLRIAARRGIGTRQARAEALPFRDGEFDGVLMALTLCFVSDPKRALMECGRVLKSGGNLLMGIVPEESPWAKEYARKASQGHPIYSHARFLSTDEVLEAAGNAGFSFTDAASTLFWNPNETPPDRPRVKAGVAPAAGFVGLSFRL